MALLTVPALGNVRTLATMGRKDSTQLSQASVGLQEQLDKLRMAVQSVAEVVNALVITGSGSSISILDVALVAATTTNIVPVNTAPADRDALLVVTTQDATGLGKITWDASFKGVTPDDNDETATVLSSYFFIGRGGFWTLAAYPNLGFAP